MEFKFVPDLVATNLSADDSSDAINKLSKLLTAKEYVSEEYAGKVIEREQEYPTGLQTKGPAIAIPHAFDDGIKGNHVAIGVLKNPVKFHSMEDMELAVQAGASQIILGTIFETDCKKGLQGKGVEFVRQICDRCPVPVYAIGGMNLERISLVRQAGAAGGCMMSGFMKL